ncbi:MAG: hypothetical protein ACXW5U_25505 [Thermoanaerobaculia bacterium]
MVYNCAIRPSLIGLLVAAALCASAGHAEPIRIRREVARQLTAGATVTITWIVTGTSEPVLLRLWNSDPSVATLVGGDVQTVTTSGGAPNTVSRGVTTIRPGQFDVQAEIVDGPSSPKDDHRASTIASAYRRELTRIATELEVRARELPARRKTLRGRDVVRVIDRTQRDVRKTLDYPELAAFHDALAEAFDDARAEAMAERAIALVAKKPDSRMPEEDARSLLQRLGDLLRNAARTSPFARVCILTTPESGAAALLYPQSFPSRKQQVTTASWLTLYVGSYAYEITRRGYVTSKGTVNLLLNSERILECPLRRGDDDAQSCRYLAGEHEGCP